MKAVLVTGANRGVGYGICQKIVSNYSSFLVVVCARKKESAEKAILELKKTSKEANLFPLEIDVTHEESVSTAAKTLKKHLTENNSSLHAIINNAGVGFDFPWSEKPFQPEIASNTLQCNFYGVLRVCSDFFPLLDKGGRVVHISSGAGPSNMKKMSPENRNKLLDANVTQAILEGCAEEFILSYEEQAESDANSLPCLDKYGWWLHAYGFSKALLNSLTTIQAKDHEEFIINSCSPGFVATDLTSGYQNQQSLLDLEQGAECPVILACTDKILTSGKMYRVKNGELQVDSWVEE